MGSVELHPAAGYLGRLLSPGDLSMALNGPQVWHLEDCADYPQIAPSSLTASPLLISHALIMRVEMKWEMKRICCHVRGFIKCYKALGFAKLMPLLGTRKDQRMGSWEGCLEAWEAQIRRPGW